MKDKLKSLLGEASECGHAVCAFSEELLITGVRSVSRLPSGSKSIILCLFPYYVSFEGEKNLSHYAMLTDYHKVAGAMLSSSCERLEAEFPKNSFVYFVDSSPINEVKSAVKAGLGALGKNHLLLTEEYGAYCFIGEIVTDLELPYSEGKDVCCGCNCCIKACPTGALSSRGVDASICRSAITQKKGELTDFETDEIKKGGLIWGCDICIEACPYNKSPKETPIKSFLEKISPLINHENLEENFKESAFSWRGKPTITRNLSILDSVGR